jgi:hypothetical protein
VPVSMDELPLLKELETGILRIMKQTTRQRPLLGSGQRATLKAHLEAVFSMWSAPRLYHATDRVLTLGGGQAYDRSSD